jgi:RNA polymerase sigma-70 factor, ECF subfamily
MAPKSVFPTFGWFVLLAVVTAEVGLSGLQPRALLRHVYLAAPRTPEAETLRQGMTGNAEFEEFYGGAVGRLLGQLLPVTGDLHEAEEVVQEAFARAFIHWSRLRNYEVPEAWVRRVAMNLAAERARRLRRRARAILRAGAPPQVPQVSVEALALLEALRTLPIRQRQALVLHHLVGLPVEEVARTLSIPSGTVKSALARGRRALAVLLDDLEEVPGL